MTTVLTAVGLLALGGLFFLKPQAWPAGLRRWGRSEAAAYLTMGLGGAWFLFHVWNLSPADELFGSSTRYVLFGIFGVTWVSCFWVVKDFLAVRGVCVLVLMAASVVLASAYALYEIPTRLFLVGFWYVLIVLAIYLGVSPYRWRDFFGWLETRPSVARGLGGALAGYGLLLLAMGFTY